jgi:ABC-type Fe3+/spermidine/putrescine transport system ATPase subunit
VVSIELNQLVKRYGDHVAVNRVDLQIPSGTFVTLLGPSGCGKTTTLRSIAGLENPDGGRIVVGDKTVVDADRGLFVPPERRRIGMVFQSYALWPHMSVAQNIAYPLRRRKWSKAQINDEVSRFLELANLHDQRDRSVAALSGGQQQRVALARAMVGDPVLTLFDEPLSNLDVKLRDRMRTEIRRLHERIGMTSVYVTHDQDEAFSLSDLVVVMNDGKIQQIAPPQAVYFHPANAFVADFVGFNNCVPARVASGVSGKIRVAFTTGVEVDVDTDLDVTPGDHLSVFARTEAVTFVDAPGRANVGTAVVTDVNYAGDTFEIHATSAEGTFRGTYPADVRNQRPFDVGAAVPLYVDIDKAVILAAPATPRHAHSSASDEPDVDAVAASAAGRLTTTQMEGRIQ